MRNIQHRAAKLIQGLKKLRKREGLSQQALAVRLGIALPTVSRWENGRSRPSPLALEKIEAFLRGMGEEGESLLRAFFLNEAIRKKR